MDLYDVLGLPAAASLADIKRAYRRLARRFHPDINPGDRTAEARFRQVVVAYEILSDPDRRHRYDEKGLVAGESAGTSFGFEGFDFSVEAAAGDQAPTFGDLFADVLRDAAEASRHDEGRGSDIELTLSISFDEAMTGTTWTVMVTRADQCRACAGAGAVAAGGSPCVPCGGTGQLRTSRGHMVFSRSCPQCGGEGRQVTCLCPVCRGEGIEARAESVVIRVPPGVADLSRLRVPGKGHAGRRRGLVGDLYVTIRVAPHPVFRREGADLHLVVPVAIHEAALGARVEVPTFDGVATVRVPPGTQSGQRLRVGGRGVPDPGGEGRGDLVVEVRLVLPRLLDERAKVLLRQFGQIQAEDVRADLMAAARGKSGPGDQAGRS